METIEMMLGAKARRMTAKETMVSIGEMGTMETYALYRYTMYTIETHL